MHYDITKTSAFRNTLLLMAMIVFTSCEHEISMDYPTSAPQVVFNGQISNEGVSVIICHSRQMADMTTDNYISDAQVWIESDNGYKEQLVFSDKHKGYISPTGLKGEVGHTYKMEAIVDGKQYEASTTMMPPAKVDTIFFRWIEALKKRYFFVCVKGEVPIPDKRNYYLFRLLRGEELFKWSTRTGRSDVDGRFEYDIVCSSEQEMDDGIDDDGKIPLTDGDSIRMELISLEQSCCEYYQSLQSSKRTTTNAVSNIRGGAQGVFMAANITRPDTIVFHKEEVLKQNQ